MNTPAHMVTVEALRRAGMARLAACGCSAPALDARVLLGHVLGWSAADFLRAPKAPVSAAAAARFDHLLERRAAGEPVAYLTGCQEFWSLPVQVTRDTLIPRADSETVIEALLGRLDRSVVRRVLDLGTGSGCLLAALLTDCPHAVGLGIDRYWSTLTIAARNARALGLGARAHFVQGDWGQAIIGSFDVIVANPPYITRADLDTLATDVRDHEPRAALDGGPDGLEALQIIVASLPRLLAPGGVAGLEFGYDQRAAVEDLIAAEPGLDACHAHPDLAGHDRCVTVKRAVL